ncbi:DUF4129 domain-containing protein [Microbacterium sp. GXS0129]|uniref:DUF4129 domain-containing protein n=1 Tax=Microbacterium sp. GXS0129 TaxID=3377836 RepID=UPI00383BED44
MRSRPETTELPRRALPAPAAIALVTAIIAIVALVSTLQGVPRVDPPDFAAASPPPLTAAPAPSTSPGALPTPPPVDPGVSAAIQLVLALLLAAVIAVIGFWLIRRLVQWVRGRRVYARTGVAVASSSGGAPEPTADVQAIRRGIAAALVRMDADRHPSDAIVAAWVGLEESAADAGLLRSPTETAGEFVTRILARDAAAAADVDTLLHLYEDVRFGERSIGDADLRVARAALGRIEAVWS